jgi:DNA invertase Pin-like site-specific DNA recombinase
MHVDGSERPFESIESAHEFMDVLAETILDAMSELSQELKVAMRSGEQRRARAAELALFKLKLLMCHVHKSRRMLNDLRMIRRLMFDERMTVERAMAAL